MKRILSAMLSVLCAFCLLCSCADVNDAPSSETDYPDGDGFGYYDPDMGYVVIVKGEGWDYVKNPDAEQVRFFLDEEYPEIENYIEIIAFDSKDLGIDVESAKQRIIDSAGIEEYTENETEAGYMYPAEEISFDKDDLIVKVALWDAEGTIYVVSAIMGNDAEMMDKVNTAYAGIVETFSFMEDIEAVE